MRLAELPRNGALALNTNEPQEGRGRPKTIFEGNAITFLISRTALRAFLPF
jgi:hypothetical protein